MEMGGGVQFPSLREAYILNLSLPVCLEAFEKFLAVAVVAMVVFKPSLVISQSQG